MNRLRLEHDQPEVANPLNTTHSCSDSLIVLASSAVLGLDSGTTCGCPCTYPIVGVPARLAEPFLIPPMLAGIIAESGEARFGVACRFVTDRPVFIPLVVENAELGVLGVLGVRSPAEDGTKRPSVLCATFPDKGCGIRWGVEYDELATVGRLPFPALGVRDIMGVAAAG